MDIDLLSKMIKELILDKDEVALPGVGGFVAEIVPSTFSDKGYTINPPYRRLSFRQRINDEDNSLAEFYASSNNVDSEDAKRIIVGFLSEMKDVLKEKKTIVFPGLGRLRATKENNFFFIADEDLDIYPGGFGLEPISLKTHEESAEEVSATVAGLKEIIDEQPKEVIDILSDPVESDTPQAEKSEIESSSTQVETTEQMGTAKNSHVSEAEYYEDIESHNVRSAAMTLLKTILICVAVLMAALLLFLLLSQIAPELTDKLLYTKEELKIIGF